jgi:hypothetical protein
LILGVLLVAGLSTLSAQAVDPRVGTWVLNAAKSTYRPGPGPKSLTVTIEAVGQAEKVTSESVSAAGQKTVTEYTAEYDGKPHPLRGSTLANMVTLKRIDAYTTQRTDTQNGLVKVTHNRVVSKDGKTMTVTTKGVNAQGQATSATVVLEKK